MGRPRKHNRHLPENIQFRHGAYYFTRGGKWLPLGKEYGAALMKYAALVGTSATMRTVKDAVWGYIEHRRPKLAAATLEGYRHSAARLCAVFGPLALEDMTPAMVYRYVSESGTVQANRDKALLSAAFTHARNSGALEGQDPTKRLQFRNEEKPRVRYVTDAELAALLAASSPRLACIVRWCYLTGMRQGDALKLKVAVLDDDGFTYWNSKSKKWQGLEWSDELLACREDAMKLWRRFGREWLFESKPKGKHAARGIGPYTPSGLRSLWRVARAKAGIPDVRLHDLRAKAGSDVESDQAAQTLLGHADAKTTKRHYRRKVERSKPTR
jgi:integrase